MTRKGGELNLSQAIRKNTNIDLDSDKDEDQDKDPLVLQHAKVAEPFWHSDQVAYLENLEKDEKGYAAGLIKFIHFTTFSSFPH